MAEDLRLPGDNVTGGHYHRCKWLERTLLRAPCLTAHRELWRGFPARSTRSEKPRPFSNGSTVAVTSSTG
jgi:hypothetical protein